MQRNFNEKLQNQSLSQQCINMLKTSEIANQRQNFFVLMLLEYLSLRFYNLKIY